MLPAGLLHRGGQIPQQVPAISDFQGVRGGFLDWLGVGGGPVAADDRGSGMPGEPGRERPGGTAGQYVHDPAGLDADQYRAVDAALAEGELVHPQHPQHGPAPPAPSAT